MAMQPIQQTSPHAGITGIYQRNSIMTPRSCIDVSMKVTNIRRLINSLEETRNSRIEINGKLQHGNKMIMILGIVQDTAMAFLDMAGALVPGKLGGVVASGGNAAINTAQSISEVAHGQGNAADIGIRTAESVLSMVPGGNMGGDYAKAKVGMVLGGAKPAVEAARGNKAEAATQARAFAINSALDTAIATANSAGESKVAGGIGKGLSIVKAANSYSAALDKRSSDYWDQQTGLMIEKAELEAKFTRDVARLRSQLNEALAEFESCYKS